MTYPVRYVLVAAMVALVWVACGPSFTRAQEGEGVTVRATGTVVNLFETLDPNRPLDALRLTLPDGWTFEEVRLLRYGTEPIPVRARSTDQAGTHLLAPESPVKGPHDLVVRVRTPDLPETTEWGLQTLTREASAAGSSGQSRFRVVDRRTQRVAVESPSPPDRANQALSLDEAVEPLRLRAEALPPLGRRSSFTIEFWLQTNGLDEVLLSTWTGDESVAYPAEFVVDRGGRLRLYSGRPGEHRALQAGRPIADGTWHHVAAVYDAQRPRLRLLLDGTPVDSLRGRVPAPPTGPPPLAVGGRLDPDPRPEAQQPPFSGQIDELRVWSGARSIKTVRRMRSRPFRPASRATEDGERRLLRLGFEADPPDAVERWPEGARRVPSTLSFRSNLQNLRARTSGRSVTLRWTADAADVDRFVVERSSGGQAFTTVATLDPSDAKQVTATGGPTYAFTDTDVAGQVVFYRIRLERSDDRGRTSSTIKIGLGAQSEASAPVKLIGNFPNPFSESTTIAYEVNQPKRVTITVWNLTGHQIAELADAPKDPGYHEIAFDATNLPSGTYFVKLETPSDTQSHRMVVLK
jgi:hypothetical protein